MNTRKRMYANRYVNPNVILRLIDLARLSFLARRRAIQYDLQNPRVRIDMIV
jgi:hypothetical protein